MIFDYERHMSPKARALFRAHVERATAVPRIAGRFRSADEQRALYAEIRMLETLFALPAYRK